MNVKLWVPSPNAAELMIEVCEDSYSIKCPNIAAYLTSNHTQPGRIMI
jgi:hypothetical protein